MKKSINPWLIAVICVGILAVFSPVSPVSAQTLPSVYSNSWIGNTYGTPADHIAHTIDNIYVTPSGKVATITDWDEGGANAALYSPTGAKIGIPDGSGTGNWGRNSGKAIFTDDNYLYQTMTQHGRDGANSNPDQYPQDPETLWKCIRRYNHNGTVAPFAGGKGWDGSKLIVNGDTSNTSLTGVVVLNNELYVSETVSGQIKVYNASTMSQTPVRSIAIANVGLLDYDSQGFIWMLDTVQKKLIRFSTTGAIQSQSITFPAGVVPTSFCVDKTKDRILVTNNGNDQNVLIYTNIFSAPSQTSTFGNTGGINSGTAGVIAPLKFSEPKGVGIDSSGNIYVGNNSVDEGGARLEKYNSSGSRQWSLNGIVFTANGDLNPSDETEFYIHDFKFNLNLGNTTPGSEWSPAAMTVNKVKYPSDARLPSSDRNKFWTTAYTRNVSGRKLLYISDMYGSNLGIYRFNASTDGETAIPSGFFEGGASSTESIWRDGNGNGASDSGETSSKTADNQYGTHIFPDSKGGVWKANQHLGVRYFPLQGFDGYGNPKYDYMSSRVITATELNDFKRLEYDAANDVLYAVGVSPGTPSDQWWEAGNKMVRFNNATIGTRSTAWSVAVPHGGTNTSVKAFCEAGDYLFLIAKNDGRIYVHRKSDGAKVGEIMPTSVTGSKSGMADFNGAIRATKRSNDEYLIFAEENGFGKIMMYRWNPTPTAVPSAPSNLGTTAASRTQINLGWMDNSSNESSFAVERSANGTSWSQIATVAANATSYASTGLTRNTLYFYRVRSLNSGGNSPHSNTASVKTLK